MSKQGSLGSTGQGRFVHTSRRSLRSTKALWYSDKCGLNETVAPSLSSLKPSRLFGMIRTVAMLIVGAEMIFTAEHTFAKANVKRVRWREQLIHILGTTQAGQSQQVGVVAEKSSSAWSNERTTMVLRSISEPGQGNFSDRTQRAIMLAIDRTAKAAHLNPDSWRHLSLFRSPRRHTLRRQPFSNGRTDRHRPGQRRYRSIHRALTGTVTNDGHIGVVSGIPFKIDAAHHEHLQRILIPDEADATDPDWRTPFLMQVSPVASISEAYEALTDRPLVTDTSTHSRASAP